MIWILFIATIALSLWAAARVKSVYRRYSQLPVRSGLSGAEVASEILRRKGIYDVEITEGEGMLGDHYDPLHKRLVLSPDNFDPATHTFVRRPDKRTKLIALSDGELIINVLPPGVQLEDVRYEVHEHRLYVTDGKTWKMDVKEFGWD